MMHTYGRASVKQQIINNVLPSSASSLMNNDVYKEINTFSTCIDRFSCLKNAGSLAHVWNIKIPASLGLPKHSNE